MGNSAIFERIRSQIKKRTGNRVDVHLLMGAFFALKAAHTIVPAMASSVFDQGKTNVSSSVIVPPNDLILYEPLRRFIGQKVITFGHRWYKFSGEHKITNRVDELEDIPGAAKETFQHNGTTFFFDEKEVPGEDDDPRLTIRCLGHSNAPLLKLLDFVRQEAKNSFQLTVIKIAAVGRAKENTWRAERSLSTIDLDLEIMTKIKMDAEAFFAEDSRGFYESIGRPYFRGWLLHGPPGTGKTSISSNPPAPVSLNGLLNVIDGAAAAEGRLLITTTNCPEKLDNAFLRAGRADEKFKIDYATKLTAELTFKRIFGLDKKNKFKPEAIDRLAKAFAAQFPSRSKICTAELAKYCGQYRARPHEAIREFADWLKVGDDKFAYRVTDLTSYVEDDGVNIPEPFNLALLEVGSDDMLD
ncbi:hypothetical protein EK21DRAFT_66734, partial [Setomelanomma holmii]